MGFTDSRQGTARFAAKLQLETERNFVRSVLYHTVADRARPVDNTLIMQKKKVIEDLENAVATSPQPPGNTKSTKAGIGATQFPAFGAV